MNVILAIALLVYLCAALYQFRLNAKHEKELTPNDWMFWINVFFAPAALLGLFAMSLVLTPFWWLYPERHAHVHDFEGTTEQQAELRRWRAELAEKPFWKRLCEKFVRVA